MADDNKQAEPGQVLTDDEIDAFLERERPFGPSAIPHDGMTDRELIRWAEAAVLRRLAQQVVAWQYRWTNPGEQECLHPGDTDWKWVEHPHWQPLESKLAELRSYRYRNKPCYEVRALCVIAAPVPQGKEGA